MLTCETPFPGENAHVVIFGVVAQDMRPPMPTIDEMDEVEVAYRACVVECWSKVRTARPPADELINRFKGMLQKSK
jgi:proto-oncogene serine/threonine-protein kinase mos